MEKIKELLQNNLNENFIRAVLSNPREKSGPSKIKARSFLKDSCIMIQVELFQNNQAFHKNISISEACDELEALMQNMKQLQLETADSIYMVLISKKGKVTIKKKNRTDKPAELTTEHDRKKKYILSEGMDIPFLKELGVMTAEGKIVSSRYDKFRQINRFLEFIADVLPELDKGRELTILDFGCGKSYLTFAMYYYLHCLKDYDIRIIGLDLKSDVIAHCNELSQKFGYAKLTFLQGNIADYTGADTVDMVVTLHACDTATDYALAKAVAWKAKVILSVPCCQHELNAQIECETLRPIMKYGLLKERMAALVTDGLRAEYLEMKGYDAQILEFIDMEHTPKNILIRAVKTGRKGKNQDTIKKCQEFLNINPALGRLLIDKEVIE